MWLPRLLGFFAIIATVCASPVHPQKTANPRLLFESTEGIFFENVVTRSNGHLLLTTFNEGRIYSFDPLSPTQEPRIVAQISGTNGSLGSVDVIFQHPMLTGTPELQMGINGIKVLDDYFYFTSSGRGLYGRFPIDAQGNIIGDLEELAWLPAGWALGYDDFALSKEGVAYVATQTNELIKITADGNQTILLDENMDLVPNSPTAATLSRDEQTVYPVTSGSSSVDSSKAGEIIEFRL
ncbi:hypothetical protein FDECE_17398 [Fusarium decemcellulare]|nr:hypothetical protein FDECE_17398 [Fusarium decemcellulare]